MTLPPAKDLEQIVEAARWAPTGDNAQPFSFHRTAEGLDLREDPRRGQAFLNIDNQASQLSLGMLLANMEIVSRSLGWEFRWELTPLSVPLAKIYFSPCARQDSPWRMEIPRRTVDRRAYRVVEASPELRTLENIAANDRGIRWVGATETGRRAAMARILSGFDSFMLGHREIHRYLFHWMRWSDREASLSGDGLPVSTLGLNFLDEKAFRILSFWPVSRALWKWGVTRMAAHRAARVYTSSSLISALLVTDRSPLTYVHAGIIWQRLWLELSRLGWVSQPMMGHALLARRCEDFEGEGLSAREQARFRREDEEIRVLLGARANERVALLFRAGPPLKPVPTRAPRRPLGDILYPS